ncbi:hypothetical protein D9M71_316170 [compost metagenome]|jgi:hypothetical protein|nr:conserved membrane protein of unknown function [Pseudomonas sp. JV241A]
MDGFLSNLVKLRIVLTFGAIAGLLPVTLVFIWGALFFLAGALGSLASTGWLAWAIILLPISMSVFCLWTSWKIYAISMATTPEVRYKRLLIAGVVATALWGVPWAYFGRTFPTTIYIFMMPGITAAAMLAIALKREQAVAKQLQS